MTDEPTTDDDRIEQLVDVVETQQKQIETLQERVKALAPTRRQILKAGGAAALVGTGAAGQAAAAPGDDGDTVWGSDSNRDDYLADEIGANTVSTGDLDTGRTWQDVTDSRAIGTTETNNTDSEILANVTVTADQDATRVGIRFNKPALDLDRADMVLDTGQNITIQTIVPSGADYNVQNFGDSTISVRTWQEFRP